MVTNIILRYASAHEDTLALLPSCLHDLTKIASSYYVPYHVFLRQVTTPYRVLIELILKKTVLLIHAN